MAEKSPTYSVEVPNDCTFDFRRDFMKVAGEVRAGTYKVPSQLRHDIAAHLCSRGKATKVVGKRTRETKGAEGSEATEGGE